MDRVSEFIAATDVYLLAALAVVVGLCVFGICLYLEETITRLNPLRQFWLWWQWRSIRGRRVDRSARRVSELKHMFNVGRQPFVGKDQITAAERMKHHTSRAARTDVVSERYPYRSNGTGSHS